MDPYLKLPPTLWTAALRRGFVGCLKDLFINGAAFDVVTYAHQQDVGEYRRREKSRTACVPRIRPVPDIRSTV